MMESSRKCAAAHLTRRIRWSSQLILTLLEIAQEMEELGLRGRDQQLELERRWKVVHPDLPSRGAALVQQLRRVRKRPSSVSSNKK